MSCRFRVRWIAEHKGCFDPPPFEALAVIAKQEGLYQASTGLGDIVSSLKHAWRKRQKIWENRTKGEEWEI